VSAYRLRLGSLLQPHDIITYSLNGYMLLFFRIIIQTHWAWHLQLCMRWVITWACPTMWITACVVHQCSVSWQSVWG